jgi:hypothetical protein
MLKVAKIAIVEWMVTMATLAFLTPGVPPHTGPDDGFREDSTTERPQY